jgi:hypothetical protein
MLTITGPGTHPMVIEEIHRACAYFCAVGSQSESHSDGPSVDGRRELRQASKFPGSFQCPTI